MYITKFNFNIFKYFYHQTYFNYICILHIIIKQLKIMSIITDFIKKISTDKITKKTQVAIGIVLLNFFERTDEINLIIHATLLTLVYVVINMLYNYPHQIDLEHPKLKNCVGLLSFINLLKKTSFVSSIDGIIRSVNSFIIGTNSFAENFMDGGDPRNINMDINMDVNVDMGTNENFNPDARGIIMNTNPTNITNITNTTNTMENTIIKSILQNFLNKL